MMPENNQPRVTRRTETTTVTDGEKLTVKAITLRKPQRSQKVHSGELGENILESLNRLIELSHLKDEKEYDANQHLKDIIQNLRKHHQAS
ncbi:hypothetical protein [Aliamphritea spongicola]|nr:hypothetical protein [Aliamphritea spongicola]